MNIQADAISLYAYKSLDMARWLGFVSGSPRPMHLPRTKGPCFYGICGICEGSEMVPLPSPKPSTEISIRFRSSRQGPHGTLGI